MAIQKTERELAQTAKRGLHKAVAVPPEVIEKIAENLYMPGEAVYDAEYHPLQALELLSDPTQCTTLRFLAAYFGVREKTLQKWIQKGADDSIVGNEYRPFAMAVAHGKAIQEKNFGNVLLAGFKYSQGIEFILSNLHDWSTKQKTEHVVDLNKAIAEQERKRRVIDWEDEDLPDEGNDNIIDVTAEDVA